MTSGGGALATAVFAVGTAGGALPGRAVFDGAVVLIWRCPAPTVAGEGLVSQSSVPNRRYTTNTQRQVVASLA